jgi:hypothetical protein
MTNSSYTSVMLPDGWKDVLVRTLTIFVITFVTLNLKEWVETREWDIPACAIDAGVIAAATFAYYAVLVVGWGGSRGATGQTLIGSARPASR